VFKFVVWQLVVLFLISLWSGACSTVHPGAVGSCATWCSSVVPRCAVEDLLLVHNNGSTIQDEATESNNRSILIEKEEIVNRFVFFDFETIQRDIIGERKLGMELEHRPNLCVVRVICDDCRKRYFQAVCGRCGNPERIFEGEDCVSTNFAGFLYNRNMKNTIAIAHNAK